MTRTNIQLPSSGRIDSEYLEALSDQLANQTFPKTHAYKLED